MMLSLQPVTDLAPFADLLRASGLPADDLTQPGRRFWRAVTGDGVTIGYGGLEGDGADVLLRSVVIDSRSRGSGSGRALVALLLAEAKAGGASKVWLLTLSAADFFRHLGFSVAARAAAPAAITTSQQFSALCPASAQLLVTSV
ncbi:MAG: GNAT family N-acetyltransferase [Rhodospirillaceae bacterium]|nr:GNAT family N-acetyltransferase [Rhodospirillaceae bacterium]